MSDAASARKSRRKGKRGEYLVRDYFRSLGFDADRVPSSGAAPGFKGDVRIKQDDKEWLVEVKNKKDVFKSIYSFFDTSPVNQHGVMRICVDGQLVAISYSALCVLDKNAGTFTILKEPKGVLKKILGLKRVVGSCDLLAIKHTRKPLLFLRFI